MSTTQNLDVVSLPAYYNFGGQQYRCVVASSSGTGVTRATSGTQAIIGIVAEDPGTTATDGSDEVAIAMIGGGGIGLVECGSNCFAGDVLIGPGSAADGRVSSSSIASIGSDNVGLGVALAGGSAGDVIPFIAQGAGGPHSA